jgi:hypothetical protein
MDGRLKLAQGLRNLPPSARQDLAQREQDIQRGKTVELLRRAGKEMYDNPIVNTAIGFTPGVGDVQAGVEAYRSANEGDWTNAGLNALGMLPFIPMLGTIAKKSDDISAAYRGSHTAPGPDFGARLDDLTGGGQMYPEDVYSPQAVRYYGTGDTNLDKESFAIAQRMRNKPEEMIDIYRAVPNEADISAINAGDWVTINPNYAKQHGESNLPEGYKILSQKVPAKSVWTNADSIHEYGYWPE